MPNNKEIERRFDMDDYPDMEALQEAYMEQSYLTVNPEIRIRSIQTLGKIECRLTIKSDGKMSRTEVELPLSVDQFNALKAMIPYPPITKHMRVYDIGGGLKLEVSKVDKGTDNEFMHAEVEFPDEETAKAWIPPEYLGEEHTNNPERKMANVWRDTRWNVKRIIGAVRLVDVEDGYKQVVVTYKDGTEHNLFKYHPEDIPDMDPSRFLGLTRKEALMVYCQE